MSARPEPPLDPDRSTARPSRRLVLVEVGQFAVAAVAAFAILAVATSVASRRIGEREAIAEVRTTTLIKAEGAVRPLATAQLLAGDPSAIRAAQEAVERNVLDRSLVRVKLWREDGTIVFSDEPALIGQRYDLDADEREALATGRIVAEHAELDDDENVHERRFGSLLEVYLPIRASTGDRLLFEAYYRSDIVDRNGARLWRSFAPIALGALVMLQLVQLPLAWSLASRLRARHREREALLSRALQASDVERRQIASDLHDGVVQDLAGVAYALSAADIRGERDDDVLAGAAETVRRAIKELRSLTVDIYPPDFEQISFTSALDDLLARARERGLVVTLRAEPPDPSVPDAVARLLYRAAQEGVRNVLAHAEAAHVSIEVALREASATLTVTDDGKGMTADLNESRAAGHVGLTALRGLVHDAGGTFALEPNEPRGTRLRVEVPL